MIHMKSNLMFYLSLLLLCSCQNNITDQLKSTIELWEGNENIEKLKNHKFVKMRETFKHLSFDVTKIPYSNDYATLQLNPKIKIIRNFKSDTINLDFVESFSRINCEYLVFLDNFIRLDRVIKQNSHNPFSKKQKVIIFKGELDDNNSWLNSKETMKLDNGWRYYVSDSKNDEKLKKKKTGDNKG